MSTTASTPLIEISSPTTVFEYGYLVLHSSESSEKVRLTLEAFQKHKEQKLDFTQDKPIVKELRAPLKPARPAALSVIDPSAMGASVPKKKNDPDFNRFKLIHSLAHIENYAIDLSWDVLLRWAVEGADGGVQMPKEFYEDWLRVACEEARHFTCWNNRLIELGHKYGDLPVHDGLWQSAQDTNTSLMDRLAIVHMVHEARGLDVTPRMLQQFSSMGDQKSKKLLQVIEEDELTHVGAGMRWYMYLCEKNGISNPVHKFHSIVREKFKGSLRGPFNHEARKKAGFTEEWYEPLALEPKKGSADKKEESGSESD